LLGSSDFQNTKSWLLNTQAAGAAEVLSEPLITLPAGELLGAPVDDPETKIGIVGFPEGEELVVEHAGGRRGLPVATG